MKLSDFNHKNNIEVTEPYPFSHTNVLSEVESKEIEKLFLRAKERNCYRILNVAPALTLSNSLFSETDLFVVNEIELESLTKQSIQIDSLDSIKESI